ncbi:MAG: winged helix-turn-helix domain-containing protein [Pyrobaculum sp.]|jgi:predicted transcriptional regulator|uniref:winged helix-turn-helix domain-containing protein n=1 Tax=unclassified Pyrobaculum TaxID=2643434 RepID=UPI0021DA6B68|nr:winged helix-turn-helix domain-containing protein [Pyrobaculum sp. 3827-6]MCU7788326.1 winged helix-turn-helix domain-containing protein [Pyrobaculum sp. 3827-6]
MEGRRKFLPDVYTAARILHVLSQSPLPTAGVAAAARTSYEKALQYLTHLAQRGLVASVDGRWHLTKEGQAALLKLEEVVKTLAGINLSDAVRKRR